MSDMNKKKILAFLLFASVLTFIIIFWLTNNCTSFPVDHRGMPRMPIQPLGQLALILGTFVSLLYPFNVLAKKNGAKESARLSVLRRGFLIIHPYAAITAVALASIHFAMVVISGRPWRMMEWTGVVSLGLAGMIGIGGLSRFLTTGKGFRRTEKGFHKWGALAVILLVLLHIS